MNPNHAKKAQRTESILSSLSRFGYLTRAQLQQMHDLKSDRNANRVMAGLGAYVSSFRVGLEKAYYLNKTGRDYVGDDGPARFKTPQAEHFLLRNQLYLYVGRPMSWTMERRIIVGDRSLVTDALYMRGKTPVLVEVDISQSMAENRAKIRRYAQFAAETVDPFELAFVTAIESRRHKLAKLCKNAGLAARVYTYQEIR